jgi:hypothetical protein
MRWTTDNALLGAAIVAVALLVRGLMWLLGWQ